MKTKETNSVTCEHWQQLNKMWWETQPMRYDQREKIIAKPGSLDYFREIDNRFFGAVKPFMPWRNQPFDPLIDFESLKQKEVLEIGVGHGSHAELIQPHCKSFTGIDLTETACQMTKRRFELVNLNVNILQMDAERMSFPDQSFDFIWSWGVIHHSSDTARIIHEMNRVLRPNGEAIVMVYHRSFWKYYVEGALVRGMLQGKLFRHSSIDDIVQEASDGAIARYYTPKEWLEVCRGLFQIQDFFVFGQKTDLILLPPGPLKNTLAGLFPDKLARLFTNQFRFGSFLVARMKKID